MADKPTLVGPKAAPYPRYVVSGFDICASGMERLRSPAEFLLVAHPSNRDGWRVLLAQWLEDLQTCDRPEGFDYPAARRAIREAAESLRVGMGKHRTLSSRYGCDFGEDGPVAFLYLRDTRA